MKRSALALILTFFLLTLIVAATLPYRLPSSLLADASPNFFSAERIVQHIEWVAATPHPTDLGVQITIQERLVDQLKNLGLQVGIQPAIGLLDPYGVAGEIANILGRLDGSDPSGAILLVAHYENVPQCPSAWDNGLGMAVMLKTCAPCNPTHSSAILSWSGSPIVCMLT